ncbi:hypothetical protein ACFW35_13060 [Fictibacillus sp. NPDC058756]|uniref:hypothetical protein n=1 Tax=Fictibacillus sp. NPDC058756 TaxID=3346625 RepID=UPI003696F08B
MKSIFQEVYQVWLIEGDKKYRSGTFIPDEKGKGAVVFPFNFPGEHRAKNLSKLGIL